MRVTGQSYRVRTTGALLAALLVSTALLIGHAKAEDLKIGVLVPTTGALAPLGIDMQNGYMQAVKDVPKIKGMSVQLVVEDSQAGIAAARAAGCLVVAARAGNFGGWDQSAAHRVVDTLEELTPSLVERLWGDYGLGMGAP